MKNISIKEYEKLNNIFMEIKDYIFIEIENIINNLETIKMSEKETFILSNFIKVDLEPISVINDRANLRWIKENIEE